MDKMVTIIALPGTALLLRINRGGIKIFSTYFRLQKKM